MFDDSLSQPKFEIEGLTLIEEVKSSEIGVKVFRVVQGHLQKECILKQANANYSYKLRREQDVLYKLLYSNLPCFGFPNILYTKSNQLTHEILISPLGPSLKEVFEQFNESINEVLVYKIIYQLINRLEKLHNANYSHG